MAATSEFFSNGANSILIDVFPFTRAAPRFAPPSQHCLCHRKSPVVASEFPRNGCAGWCQKWQEGTWIWPHERMLLANADKGRGDRWPTVGLPLEGDHRLFASPGTGAEEVQGGPL